MATVEVYRTVVDYCLTVSQENMLFWFHGIAGSSVAILAVIGALIAEVTRISHPLLLHIILSLPSSTSFLILNYENLIDSNHRHHDRHHEHQHIHINLKLIICEMLGGDLGVAKLVQPKVDCHSFNPHSHNTS